jgi:hypothetical protein
MAMLARRPQEGWPEEFLEKVQMQERRPDMPGNDG